MDGIWIEVILIGVAIVANGFFAGSELALASPPRARLAELRAKGFSGAAVAEALKREPERFLATIQIAITLVGTLASAVGGAAAGGGRRAPPARTGGGRGRGGRRASLAREPESARGAAVERAGGPRHRDPAHHLLLPRAGRAHAEGAGPAQSRGLGRARGPADRVAGARARRTRPDPHPVHPDRPHRDRAPRPPAGAAGLRGGGEVPGPRGRLPGRVRGAGERSRPPRVPVHRHRGAPRHGAAAEYPGARHHDAA